ncbi:MAG: TIGR04222 domain-containing membrane protein [Methylocystis sp.]|nr:MAG: TIGR04222 domain-containing membrane protein [Methylocystis sp.]
MENLPFLSLPGPEFLNVFGVLAIIVLVAAWIAIRLADRTDVRPPPPVPQKPDPIEVAFLQGGVNQVIRTVVYDLVQRGYAALAPEDRIVYTNKTPQPGELDPVEARVLESIQAKPKAHELFSNLTARRTLLERLEPVRARLAAQDLIKPDSVKIWRTRAQIFGTLALLGFASAKIYVALSTGHKNVSYLIFLCIAALLALFVLCYALTRKHASRRGRAWLEAMKTAYEPRLKEAVSHIGSPGPEARAFEGASLFLIGLYGFSALKGTSEEMFATHFKRASGDGGGGCGSSCGGSCGSGDGGGGCGGCGGGD